MRSVQMAVFSKIQDYLRTEYNIRIEGERFSYRLFPHVQAEIKNFRIFGGPQNQNQFVSADYLRLYGSLSILWTSDRIVEKLQIHNPDADLDYPPHPKVREKKESRGSFQIEEIEVTGGKARLEKYQIEELHLKSSLKTDELVIRELEALSHGAELTANGRIYAFDKLQYDLNFSVQGDASAVQPLVADAPSLSGPVSASGKIGGYGNKITIQGILNAPQLSIDRSSPFELKAQYEIITADPTRPYRIQLRFSDFPVSALRKYFSEVSLIASFATGTLHYEGGTDPFAAKGSMDAVLRAGGRGTLPVSGAIHGNLKNGSLILSPSNLVVRSSTATFSGTIMRQSLDLAVRAKIGDTTDLAALAPDLRKLPGSYRVESRVQGPFQNLKIDGNVTGTSSGMNVQAHGSFSTGSEQVQAVVRANFDGRALRRLDLGNVSGNFELESTVQGQIKSPRLEGRLLSSNVTFHGIQIGDATVDFYSDETTLNATAKIPTFETEVNGSYIWKSAQFIVDATATDLTSEKLKPILLASVQGIEGSISAILHAEGNAKRWKNADAQLEIQSAKFTYQQLPIEIESGSRARMQKGHVNADFRGKVGSGSINVTGTYSLARNRYDLSARLSGIKLEEFRQFLPQIPANAQGNITGVLTAHGDAKLWRDSEAEVRFEEAFLKRNEFEVWVKSDSSILMRQRGLIVDLDIALPEGEFHVQGRLPVEGTSGADLRAVGNIDLKIASMFTDQVLLSGKAALDVRVHGNLKNPEIFGDSSSQNFTAVYPARKLFFRGESATAMFSGQDIQLAIKGAMNEAPVQVQGVVPIGAAKPGNIRVNLESFPLQTLTIHSDESDFSGTASLSLQAEGTGIKPENWDAKAELKLQNIRVGETTVETESIRVRLEQQRLTVEPFQIKAPKDLSLSVSGAADLKTQNLQADVKTEVDLIFFRNLLPDFSGSGKLIAEVHATDSFKDPQMSGLISLDDGFMRIPDYPIVIEQIYLRAPFDKNRVKIEKLTARMGGGTIEGYGQFDLKNFRPAGAIVSLTAKGVRLNYPEDLRSQIDANLKFTSIQDDYLLSGDVDIVRSIYTEDIDYRDRLVNSLLSHKRALAPTATLASRIRLDLNVKTIEDFRMRNNLARIRALASLQVQGNTSQPRLLGRVQVRDGSVLFFRGNEYVVERGNVDFYGTRKINPEFDFQLFALVDNNTPPDFGEFAVDQYEVEISVRGTLDDLEDTTVRSFPDLDEQAIYSLLLTGGTNSTLSQAGSAVFQEELASYFAGQLFFGAPQQLGKALGLNRVEIHPDLVSSEQDPSARLIVGKDLTSHLGIIYSVSLSDSEDQTWIVNYRLLRNFSMRFVDESDEGYTVGLRHSLRFGPGAASLRSKKLSKKRETEVIEKIEIKNDSPIPDQDVFKKVDELQRRTYDYWEVNDQIMDVKLFLQERGYLFPEVSFEETRPSTGKVHLTVRVSGRGQRNMVFSGYQPSKGRIKKYEEWWREGFSEQAVLEQISDDLLKELWQEGFLRAQVEIQSEITNDSGRYVFQIDPEAQYVRIALKFRGADLYGAKNLQDELMKLYGSDTSMHVDAFHRFRILKDRIGALYAQKGFLDVTVKEATASYTEDGLAEREIVINEGHPARIDDLEVSNGQGFPAELIAKLKAGRGKTYSPQAISEDLITVTEFYESSGYPNIEVDSEILRQPGDPGLTLRYNLKTGIQARIGSVRIVGNNSTRRSVIEKRLRFREGDLLVRSKLFESQRNLYRTRNFQLVRVEAEEGEKPDLYDVTVDVTESRKYRATYGIRYNTETDLEGEIVLQDSRLFGMSQNISLFTRVNSIEQDFGITYSIPPIYRGLIRGLDWDVLVSARYEREDREGFLSRDVTLSFQKQFELWGPFVTLGEYRYEWDRVTGKVQTGPIRFDVTSTISQVVGTILADTRDEPLNAKRGYFISLENRFAPSFLNDDELFERFFYQFFYYQPVGRMIWASGFRTGFAFPEAQRLIISERFFAGGSSTVRGFKLDSLGPKDPFEALPLGGEGLMIINQEIRVPIYKWFGAVVFYDGGNVWVKAGEISLGDLRHTVGLGLRVETPFGVGRFDWGVNLDPQFEEPRNVFHFGLGQAF